MGPGKPIRKQKQNMKPMMKSRQAVAAYLECPVFQFLPVFLVIQPSHDLLVNQVGQPCPVNLSNQLDLRIFRIQLIWRLINGK